MFSQGLLKVAVENARAQDKQIQAEKRELKMELYREREMRESLERQLTSELQSRGLANTPTAALLCFLNVDTGRHFYFAARGRGYNTRTQGTDERSVIISLPQPPSRSVWRRRKRPRGSCRRLWSLSRRGGREWRTPWNTRPRPPLLPSHCTPPITTPRTVWQHVCWFLFMSFIPSFCPSALHRTALSVFPKILFITCLVFLNA